MRVEYKKVLQAGEKERIEREKAIRRMRSMQIEKEHAALQHQQYDDFGPVINTPFTPSRSFSASSPFPGQQHQYSPPQLPPLPTPQPYIGTPTLPTTPGTSKASTNELDLNDPSTLEIYSRILLFKDDRMRDELAFSRTLSPKQRRVVHLVAQKLGVYHYSVGEGDERYAVVTRIDPASVRRHGYRSTQKKHLTFLSIFLSYFKSTKPRLARVPARHSRGRLRLIFSLRLRL